MEIPRSYSLHRALAVVASAIIILAALKAAAPILAPVAVAALLVMAMAPLVGWMRARGLRPGLATLAAAFVTLALLVGVIAVLYLSLLELRGALPRYVDHLHSLQAGIFDAITARGFAIPPELADGLVSMERALGIAAGTLRGAAGLVTTSFLVLLVAGFMAAEVPTMPRKLRAAIGRSDADLGDVIRVVHEVQRYLLIKTAVSLATGTLIGLWTLLLGLDFPLFWGTTAFLLNFIPNIGSVIAAIPAVLMALVDIGVGGALGVAGGYLAVNIALGNILEPTIAGRGLGLAPLAVILALVFWGWMWGILGMFLAVPLTVAARIALEAHPATRWLAVLMGRAPPAAAPVPPRADPALPR